MLVDAIRRRNSSKKLLGRRTCCGRLFNRHERLFCCGSFGITILHVICQGVSLVLVCWLTLLAVNEGSIYFTIFDTWWINLLILACSVAVFTLTMFFCLPYFHLQYTLVTSIQMMKKRGLVEHVIHE